MKFRYCATFLFSVLIFNLPDAYADELSEGRDQFLYQCVACHAFTCNKDGPRLGGLFGRKAGKVEDYDGYSDGLKESEIVWTEKMIDDFLKDPVKIFPNSVMADNGKIEDAAQRQKLIAFLKTEDPTVNLCPQE